MIAVDLNEQIILHYFILHVCTYCCALSGSAMAVTNVNFVNYLLRNKFIDKVKSYFLGAKLLNQPVCPSLTQALIRI